MFKKWAKKVEKEVSKAAKKVEKEVSKGAKQVEKEASKGAKKVEKEVSKGAKKVEKEVSKGAKKVEKEVSRASTDVVQEFKRVQARCQGEKAPELETRRRSEVTGREQKEEPNDTPERDRDTSTQQVSSTEPKSQDPDGKAAEDQEQGSQQAGAPEEKPRASKEVEDLIAKTVLSDNHKDTIRALANNTCPQEVSLNSAELDLNGVYAVAAALKGNTCLTTLRLQNNGLGDEAAIALADLVRQNTTLTVLDLRHNAISTNGGTALGAAFAQNTTLHDLRLQNNTAACARAFGAALPLDRASGLTWGDDDAEGKAGFDAGCEEKRQATLDTACKNGDIDSVAALISQAADINHQNEQGDTPLHVACRFAHPDIIQLLLEKGADSTVKNNKGETAHDVAQSSHTAVLSIQGLNPQAHAAQQQASAVNATELEQEELTDATDHRESVMAAMHQIAQHSDTQTAGRAKLMLVGEGRAGKTSTLHSLMGDDFNKGEHSTFGADSMDLSVIVESMDVCNWQHLASGLSEYMRTLLGTALAQTSGMDAAMKEAMIAALKEHQQRVKQQQLGNDGEGDGDNSEEDVDGDENTQHGTPSSVPKKTSPTPDHVQGDDHHSSSSPAAKPSQSQYQQHNASAEAADTGLLPKVSTEEIEKAIKNFNLNTTTGEGSARVTFKVFDLGGQSTFYIFHPFFLTEYAVYLLVFSMEDLLHQDESKRAETWEFLEHWLSSLHLHAKGAPVLIVGTHADKIDERKQHEGISCGIYNRLCHNAAFPSVLYNGKNGLWFWPVDNTKSKHDPMIKDLRQTISSTAVAQEYVNQQVAVPYLHLYDRLNAIALDEKRPLLTFDEVVEIARACGLRTRDETRACLKFFHLYSMVLYYDNVPGMDQFVILSPQWAVDTMTRVIRNFGLHYNSHDQEAMRLEPDLWQDLIHRAILHRRLLDVLWRDIRDDVIEPFLHLMMEYGLCVEYSPPVMMQSGHHQQHQHQQQQQQYLVPAILPMTLEDEQASSSVTLSTAAAQQANPYVGYEEKTAYIVFSLREFKRGVSAKIADTQQASFLPEGLFPMVLARMMAHMQHGATEPPMLSRTHAIIFVDIAEIRLQLVPAVGGIKIQITSPRPRTLLQILFDTITVAVKQRFGEIRASLLLPFDKSRLLFHEEVHRHHRNKRFLRVAQAQPLSPDDLVTRFGPLLPVLGQQDEYDVFISYRQRGNAGLVMTLHPKLERHGLVGFVDANNLETGLNFKHACLTALQHSVVACPIVSVAAIHQMRSLGHNDTCDNVLLEWMAMLELQQLVHQHSDKIRLRRIVPLFISSGWHGPNYHAMSTAEASEYDSFDRLKRLVMALPDVVSKETAAALDQYFAQVLHLPPPQQHKSVRQVVLSLFDIDAVIVFGDASDADRATQLRHMAERVRRVVVTVKSKLSASTSSSASTPATSTSTFMEQQAFADATDALAANVQEWLQSISLLTAVGPALVAFGVCTFNDLDEALAPDVEDDFRAELRLAGVKPLHITRLIKESRAREH
ncbi:hypothetical protein PTSG_03500 [Salpingoeca rosetta]|uniref:non-specific serine/threonine protein kinase n=1 Tax=Salpingoeca rosetta (strain ATCC 50818 / BSB-021) TaxID=946362 RepID=F2U5S8_SALR5|nr:uncharacterized protein PTSG_03500 [Salpingoeca rosetta]EGD82869.1 hypothetical protein PTSG_03500 [Salpingoeca rosetta]|eukprot:XP_004995233.1 hypothetical protein PTSG_03500 [Salpingoeca rosetta]